jgi:hypothetical protein
MHVFLIRSESSYFFVVTPSRCVCLSTSVFIAKANTSAKCCTSSDSKDKSNTKGSKSAWLQSEVCLHSDWCGPRREIYTASKLVWMSVNRPATQTIQLGIGSVNLKIFLLLLGRLQQWVRASKRYIRRGLPFATEPVWAQNPHSQSTKVIPPIIS